MVRSKLRLDKTWMYSIDSTNERDSLLAVGSLASKIHLISCKLDSNKKLVETQALTGHRGAVKALRYLSSEYLISGSSDSLIGVWNLHQTHKYMAMLQGHMSDINTLDVCSTDNNIFLSGGADVSVKVWDIRLKSPEVCSFLGGESSITCVKFLPGFMETFAVSSDDSKIRYILITEHLRYSSRKNLPHAAGQPRLRPHKIVRVHKQRTTDIRHREEPQPQSVGHLEAYRRDIPERRFK
jgi:WD40 repeat protein